MEKRQDNILLVANWPSDVGYAWWLMERFWIAIASHFKQQDRSTFLVYPEIRDIPVHIAGSCIETSELDMQDRSEVNMHRITAFIRGNGIRYVYLSDYPSHSPFYRQLRNAGVSVIAVHDHSPGDRAPARGLKKMLKSIRQRIGSITADSYIAVSDFVYDRFIKVNCSPAQRCHVARNGITPIDLASADRSYVHKEFGIAEDRTIVVTSSRAARYKGIDFMIRCAARLSDDPALNSLIFLFCGDGPDMEEFKNLAEELDVSDRFIFAGKRSDVRRILPGCDIGLHASHGEVGYSLSTLEYMSAGLVTIVPDLPSTSLATRHMENGLIYRHQDVGSACDAIRTALDPSVRDTLTQTAIDEVLNNYDINDTVEDLITILDENFRSTSP